jgi:hypothetical protein
MEISYHMYRKTEENHENPGSGRWCPIFEPGTPE